MPSRPTTSATLLLTLGALLSISCGPPQPDVAEVAAEPEPPLRIVAIGDIHGDLDAARAALRLAGVVDVNDEWIGGKTVVVQTGDILDRGDEEGPIMTLFRRLGVEARSAGGEVHVLNGNHELMNAYLDFRYVTEGGFEAFSDLAVVDETDTLLASLEPQERLRAAVFRPGGPVALELAQQATGLKVEETVFVHGGILPEQAEMGLDSMNSVIQGWLRGEAPQPEWIRGDRSPVWTRLYSDQPNLAACDTLGFVLNRLGAQRMVVGHTVQRTGVTAFCGGRVWCIDVGQAAYYRGRPEVLEIQGDRVRSLR